MTLQRSRPSTGPPERIVGPRLSREGCGSWRCATRGRGVSPPTRSASPGICDPDLVRDAVDAVHARHVVVGRVAFELVADVALERNPALLDLDVDRVRRDLYVPGQELQRVTADLVVLAAIGAEQADLELVVDRECAVDVAGVLDRSTTLAEALDRAAKGDGLAVGRDGDLDGIGDTRIESDAGQHLVPEGGVREHECSFRSRYERNLVRLRPPS